MLPFTKRPGRPEDGDVVTKDDLEQPTSGTKRSQPPPATASARARQPSFSDEELTNLIPSKSLNLEAAQQSRPLPAAGRPAAAPSSGAVPAPRSSARAMRSFKDEEEEEEDGRTVVRGAPKIVKRGKPSPNSSRDVMGGMNTSPTTISPAAVIKQTLQSAAEARAAAGNIGAGPSRSLDMQMHPADEPQNTMMLDPMRATGPQQMMNAQGQQMGGFNPQMTGPHLQMSAQMATAAMAMTPIPQARPSSRPGPMPMGMTGPHMAAMQGTNPGLGTNPGMMHPSLNPANMTGPHQIVHQSYPPAPPGYGPYSQPVPSASVPGVAISQTSMPAHFMTAQAPYSDPRMDPPGTSITQRGSASAGRPAMSWAAALLAFGLFVGVGAVAVMQGNADNVAATTGQFVDPASAAKVANGGPAKPNGAPTQAGEKVAVPTVGVPVNDPNAPVVVQPGQQVVVAQPGQQVVVSQPGQPAVIVTAAQPGTQPPPATATVVSPPATQPPVAVAAATPAPAKKNTYHRPAAAAEEDPPAPKTAPAPKTTKPSGKPAAPAGDDEELAKSKKMLEKMQEEQLGGAKF